MKDRERERERERESERVCEGEIGEMSHKFQIDNSRQQLAPAMVHITICNTSPQPLLVMSNWFRRISQQ